MSYRPYYTIPHPVSYSVPQSISFPDTTTIVYEPQFDHDYALRRIEENLRKRRDEIYSTGLAHQIKQKEDSPVRDRIIVPVADEGRAFVVEIFVDEDTRELKVTEYHTHLETFIAADGSEERRIALGSSKGSPYFLDEAAVPALCRALQVAAERMPPPKEE